MNHYYTKNKIIQKHYKGKYLKQTHTVSVLSMCMINIYCAYI